MNIWIILLSMAGGVCISELYHARMWKLYKQGKSEGRVYSQDVRPKYEIHSNRAR